MGAVYLARHLHTGEEIAIKAMQKKNAELIPKSIEKEIRRALRLFQSLGFVSEVIRLHRSLQIEQKTFFRVCDNT